MYFALTLHLVPMPMSCRDTSPSRGNSRACFSRRRGPDFRSHHPSLLTHIGYEERKSLALTQGIAIELTLPDDHYLPNWGHVISVSGRMENLAYSATAAGQFLSTLICLSVLGLTSVASIMHGDDVRMQCIIVYISCFQPVPLYCMYVRSTVGFEGKRKGKKTEREREKRILTKRKEGGKIRERGYLRLVCGCITFIFYRYTR